MVWKKYFCMILLEAILREKKLSVKQFFIFVLIMPGAMFADFPDKN